MLLDNPPLGSDGSGPAADPVSLLFFGIDYAPEVTGIGPYTTGMAEEMAARGHRVEVVTGQARRPSAQPGRGLWSDAKENGVTVRRCPLYRPRRPTAARQLLHRISFMLAAILPLMRSVRASRPDAIVAIAPALLAAVLPFLLARILRVPFWLHLHEVEAEAAHAAGLARRQGMAGRLAHRLEEAMILRADQVSCTGEAMSEAVRRKGAPRERVATLRNWANRADALGRANGAAVRRELGAGRRTVAMYTGDLSARQNLGLVVEAARRLRHRRDLLFVVCGEGPKRAELEERAAGLGNVVFRAPGSPAALAAALRAADIHLLPQPGGLADLVLPFELPNMLASGKPVVATAGAGTSLAGEVIGAGLAVPPDDAAALARAVTLLADDRELAEAFGAEGRRRAAARWSADLAFDRFERRLARAVRRRDRLADERSKALVAAE